MPDNNQLPILSFAHANGFTKGSYNVLLDILSKNFEIIGLDMHGHNPKYPVTENWTNLTQEYLDYLAPYEKVIGVGHSFGGLLTYLAALKQPEKFSAIVIMEPPLAVGNLSVMAIKIAKKLRLMDMLTPSKFSKKRREIFDSKAHALEYFSKKHFFANFEPQCLKDYVDSAIIEENGKAHLRFSRDIETQIFRKMPDNLRNAHQKLEVPMALIYALDSNLLNTELRMRALVNRDYNLVATQGGHMFPLEYPQDTAKLINKTLSKLLVGNAVSRKL